jgi:hypothetical protein
MKVARILLAALTLSLAACGSEITGPESSPQLSEAPAPARGIGVLGSGT